MRTTIGDTELYFDVEGPQLVPAGDGLRERPTVLVLHGGPGFDQGYLRPGLAPLAADAQLVFVDLRGQGRSARVAPETCTLERMADDAAALCERLGIERPIVFGHSAGGFVALQLALRHPERTGGLILCGTKATFAPIPDDDPPPGLADRAGAEGAAAGARLFGGDLSEASRREFMRAVLPYYGAPSHMDVPGRLLALTRINGDVTAYFFGTLRARYDVSHRLGEIAAPTLVVVGREDWVCAPVYSRALAAGIPDARLVEIRDAGHFAFSEEPEAFLAAARSYLAERAESVPA
jgi:proline iminopeptidase